MVSKDEVIRTAADTIFGKPLVTNVYRSVIVEAIVAAALPEWTWCSADYFPYDFVHRDGTRLEVKQSAMRQSWETKSPPKPSWDIAARSGYYIGSDWTEKAGRNADIYVLALHGVVDESADHRDPEQWRFFVIPAHRLPPIKRIGLAATQLRAQPIRALALGRAVADAAREVAHDRKFGVQPAGIQKMSG